MANAAVIFIFGEIYEHNAGEIVVRLHCVYISVQVCWFCWFKRDFCGRNCNMDVARVSGCLFLLWENWPLVQILQSLLLMSRPLIFIPFHEKEWESLCGTYTVLKWQKFVINSKRNRRQQKKTLRRHYAWKGKQRVIFSLYTQLTTSGKLTMSS